MKVVIEKEWLIQHNLIYGGVVSRVGLVPQSLAI